MTASIRGRIAESLQYFGRSRAIATSVASRRRRRRRSPPGWAYSVAIIVYTYDVGGAGPGRRRLAIKLVPAAIASAPLATLADRTSKKRVLVGSGARPRPVDGRRPRWRSPLMRPVALVIAIACCCWASSSTALQPAVSAMLPEPLRATGRTDRGQRRQPRRSRVSRSSPVPRSAASIIGFTSSGGARRRHRCRFPACRPAGARLLPDAETRGGSDGRRRGSDEATGSWLRSPTDFASSPAIADCA